MARLGLFVSLAALLLAILNLGTLIVFGDVGGGWPLLATSVLLAVVVIPLVVRSRRSIRLSEGRLKGKATTTWALSLAIVTGVLGLFELSLLLVERLPTSST